MDEALCNCKIPPNLQKEKMAKAIMDYVARIEPELRTEDTEYERRLNICSTCHHLIEGLTCGQCGCFVLARARKRNQGCPAPEGDRWEEKR